MRRYVLLLALLLAALAVIPGRAAATTTCSVTSVTGLSFGTVDPTSGTVDTTATLTFRCTYSGTLGSLFASYITMCVGLGSGSQASLNPRQMINGSNDPMNFQIYRNTARGAGDIWGPIGNATYPPFTFNTSFTLFSNGTSGTGTITLYGRVPAGQTLLSPGSYLNTLNGSFAYRYTEALLGLGTYPASCQSGGTGGGTGSVPAFAATANVNAVCKFTGATNLDFGSVPGLLTANTDRTSTISLTCTNKAPWQVGLDNGLNASGNTRRMLGSGGAVTYGLYRDNPRQLRWGNTLNTDTASGSGSGTTQSLTVYGRVPPQSAVPAGNYSDKITVTVTY